MKSKLSNEELLEELRIAKKDPKFNKDIKKFIKASLSNYKLK